ncbi:HNH endonuclease [Tenacibaculum phage JQ]|nr:HNH endonuclease [Tenacibaculum phage JQ]
MKTKTCTKCNLDLPATKDYFNSQKNGKYGLRSACKKCNKEYRKKYTSTEEYKKRHREKMAKWRKENPKKLKEINRRCYNKHAERINKERRERYHTDPIYKEKCKERERAYKESGGRGKIHRKPEQMEKSRIRSRKRRLNPEKQSHDRMMNAMYREKNKELLKLKDKERRKELIPSYVAQCMRVSVDSLTPEIYETKKLVIKLKRELKNNNVKIR